MGFLNSKFPNYLLALKTLDLLTTFFRVIDFRKKKTEAYWTPQKTEKEEEGILLIIMQRRER